MALGLSLMRYPWVKSSLVSCFSMHLFNILIGGSWQGVPGIAWRHAFGEGLGWEAKRSVQYCDGFEGFE